MVSLKHYKNISHAYSITSKIGKTVGLLKGLIIK